MKPLQKARHTKVAPPTAAASSSASTPVPSYSIIPGLAKPDFSSSVEELVEIQNQIRELEEKKDLLKTKIETYLIKSKVKSVMVGNVTTTRVTGTHKHIDRSALLKYGVKEETIEKATVEKEWSSVRLTVRKPAAGGEDAHRDE